MLEWEISAGRGPEVVAKAHLHGERGPNRLSGAPPSREAWDLAVTLACLSLEPLQRAFTLVGPRLAGNGWRVGAPGELTSEATKLGIPLLGACSEDALFAALHMRLARELGRFDQVHDDLSVRLTRFLGRGASALGFGCW